MVEPGTAVQCSDFEVTTMNGYHSSDGYRIEPLDDRDSEEPEYTIDPVLSCSNTDFGGEDPAVRDPDPKPEMAPAWNTVERNRNEA